MVAEPVPFLTTRYQCPFCLRARSTKRAAAEHITRCWYNPAAQSCKTCANYDHEPDGEPCDPSSTGTCHCNDGHEDCEAGVDLSDGLKTGCPLWSLRKAA